MSIFYPLLAKRSCVPSTTYLARRSFHMCRPNENALCNNMQLLRTRRPFVASITDALGNELFRVRFLGFYCVEVLLQDIVFEL